MIIIRNYQNIENVRKKGSPIYSHYINHLEKYFSQLYQALGDSEPYHEFSLEEHGYFVILEETDNIRSLREVGLNPEDGGLLGISPEYVERELLEDGTLIYKIAILYDNEYMMFFYSKVGQFDTEVEKWLAEQYCGLY